MHAVQVTQPWHVTRNSIVTRDTRCLMRAVVEAFSLTLRALLQLLPCSCSRPKPRVVQEQALQVLLLLLLLLLLPPPPSITNHILTPVADAWRYGRRGSCCSSSGCM